MKKHYVSRKYIDWMIQELINRVVESGKKYTRVVGIKNGGLHISQPMATALGLPHHEVHISYYTTKKPIFKNINFSWEKTDNVLIVDDLIDLGRTITALINHCRQDLDTEPDNIDMAVLFWKHGSIKPTYYIEEKPDKWIVFPWEPEWKEELC
jgi:hypoxanthine phosphoribosyltransferase